MPAITRSQSKNINSINVLQDESKFFNKLKNMFPNPNPKPNPINSYDCNKSSFVSYFKKMLEYSRDYNYKASTFKYLMKINSKIHKNNKPYYIGHHNHFYYENVRVITEILYSVIDWIDGFLVVNGVVQNSNTQLLIDTVYSRIIKFETQINGAPENPTKEEAHIMNTFVNQLQETKKALNPYISQKHEFARRSNRNIKKVCYMWMDTIEPEDVDGITNIWEDITIYEDPNYDPSSEEEDEEEDEEKDEEEDEDNEDGEEFDDIESDEDEESYSVYSDEPDKNDESNEEDKECEDFVIEQVSSNHIRFVY